MVWYIFLGVAIGVLVTLIACHFHNDGNLVANIPDIADEPVYLTSEWKITMNQILAKKRVKLKVIIRHLNSQK